VFTILAFYEGIKVFKEVSDRVPAAKVKRFRADCGGRERIIVFTNRKSLLAECNFPSPNDEA